MKIRFNNDCIDFDHTHDINLLKYIFNIIDQNYNVKIIEKLEAPYCDQVYWDLKINNLNFTLHDEHYLGVSLYIYKTPTILSSTKIKSMELLKNIYNLIKKDKIYLQDI